MHAVDAADDHAAHPPPILPGGLLVNAEMRGDFLDGEGEHSLCLVFVEFGQGLPQFVDEHGLKRENVRPGQYRQLTFCL